MTVFWVQREFEQGVERFLVVRSKKSSRQRRPKLIASVGAPMRAWDLARNKAFRRTGHAFYTTLPNWVRLDADQDSSRGCWMEKEVE